MLIRCTRTPLTESLDPRDLALVPELVADSDRPSGLSVDSTPVRCSSADGSHTTKARSGRALRRVPRGPAPTSRFFRRSLLPGGLTYLNALRPLHFVWRQILPPSPRNRSVSVSFLTWVPAVYYSIASLAFTSRPSGAAAVTPAWPCAWGLPKLHGGHSPSWYNLFLCKLSASSRFSLSSAILDTISRQMAFFRSAGPVFAEFLFSFQALRNLLFAAGVTACF